jgi:hypothetical protein
MKIVIIASLALGLAGCGINISTPITNGCSAEGIRQGGRCGVALSCCTDTRLQDQPAPEACIALVKSAQHRIPITYKGEIRYYALAECVLEQVDLATRYCIDLNYTCGERKEKE